VYILNQHTCQETESSIKVFFAVDGGTCTCRTGFAIFVVQMAETETHRTGWHSSITALLLEVPGFIIENRLTAMPWRAQRNMKVACPFSPFTIHHSLSFK